MFDSNDQSRIASRPKIISVLFTVLILLTKATGFVAAGGGASSGGP